MILLMLFLRVNSKKIITSRNNKTKLICLIIWLTLIFQVQVKTIQTNNKTNHLIFLTKVNNSSTRCRTTTFSFNQVKITNKCSRILQIFRHSKIEKTIHLLKIKINITNNSSNPWMSIIIKVLKQLKIS